MNVVKRSMVRVNIVSRVAPRLALAGALAMTLPVMQAQSAERKMATAAEVKKGEATPEATAFAATLLTVDEKGQPMGGVTVRGFQTDKKGPITPFAPDFTGTTDEQGRWHAELPFGRFMVLATKGDLVAPYREGQTWWTLDKKKPKADLKLVLVNGGSVQVTVRDAATHKPVPGAKLIMDSGHAMTADGSGQALFTAVPLGEHVLKTMSPPLANAHTDFNSTGRPQTSVEVLLNPGFEVRGRVTDAKGAPVKDAVVEDNYSGSTFLVQMQVCVTDADGNYSLGWYARSRPLWSLSVTHKDYADQSRSSIPPPAEGNTVRSDFVLDKGAEIAGVVQDESGKPVKGATVRYGSSWSLIGLRWARTNAEGKFRIARIGREEMREIVVESEGHAPTWQNATPGKGASVPQLAFTVKRGYTVKGRVEDRHGKPLRGITLCPQSMIGGRWEYCGHRVNSDAQGRFELGSLSAEASLDAVGSKHSPVRGLKFDPTQPLVIVMDEPGVIIGKVIDAETRQPVKKFNVRLGFPKEKRGADEPSASYSSHLSGRGQDSQAEDGKFVIEDLITRAGHAVTIAAEGYTSSYTDKVVAQSATDPKWPQEFTLDRGSILLGRLTDATSGNPIGGARVFYVGKEKWYSGIVYAEHLADLRRMGSYDDVEVVRSDPSGAVELRLPRNATVFTAVILADGYAPVVLEEQSAKEVALDVPPMQREAKIRGTAAGLTGLDASKDKVFVLTPGFSTADVKLQPDGSFEIAGLPPGKALVTVRDGSGRSIRGCALVELIAGEAASVDVVKQAPAAVKIVVTDKGVAVPGADVSLNMTGWAPSMIPRVGSGITGADGSLTLRHMPLVKGTVYCNLDPEKGPFLSEKIDLGDPGHPAELFFEMPAVKRVQE